MEDQTVITVVESANDVCTQETVTHAKCVISFDVQGTVTAVTESVSAVAESILDIHVQDSVIHTEPATTFDVQDTHTNGEPVITVMESAAVVNVQSVIADEEPIIDLKLTGMDTQQNVIDSLLFIDVNGNITMSPNLSLDFDHDSILLLDALQANASSSPNISQLESSLNLLDPNIDVGNEADPCTRKIACKGTADPLKWKHNAKALKRMHGEAQEIKRFKCSCCETKMDESARQKLFEEFWAVDWNRKMDFVISNTTLIAT
jgi:hypothetical protein